VVDSDDTVADARDVEDVEADEEEAGILHPVNNITINIKIAEMTIKIVLNSFILKPPKPRIPYKEL